MKKSFTQEQIVATLHAIENGTSVADACRKIGVTVRTVSRWQRIIGSQPEILCRSGRLRRSILRL